MIRALILLFVWWHRRCEAYHRARLFDGTLTTHRTHHVAYQQWHKEQIERLIQI